MQYNTNFNDVLNKSPIALSEWPLQEFSVQIPQVVVTPDDMKLASETLLKLASIYSYVMALSSYAKLKTREAKRYLSKEEHEDMVDRKEVLENFTKAVQQSYAAVSRAVTIYIENNNELKMGRGVS